MKPKFKDYYGNPLENGIYFIAKKYEGGCLCKIILDENEKNFEVAGQKYYLSYVTNPKSFAKKLIPFKGSKANLEWAILNLNS